MILVDFHLIQGKDNPLQIILSMIKMQFDDLISLKAHTNLMLMNLKVEKLDIGIDNSILYGFINILGLNIVSRRKSHFALCATCLQRRKLRNLHLLKVAGELGIEMMHLIYMWEV